MMDPEKYQELLSARDDTDGLPARVTRYQATKCAAIILAGLDGHLTYAQETRSVALFLQAAAFEAGMVAGLLPRSAGELWRHLDALPWPAPGRPHTPNDPLAG